MCRIDEQCPPVEHPHGLSGLQTHLVDLKGGRGQWEREKGVNGGGERRIR